MAFQGLQGLGGPINYYDMIPDFRREALMETQNRVGQQAVIESQMKNAQAQKDNQRRDAFYEAIQTATPEQLTRSFVSFLPAQLPTEMLRLCARALQLIWITLR